VRQLLAHRSGAIGVDGGFTIDELADDRLIAARLASQKPYWAPGTTHGYHAFVIAALVGEVVRRVTGRSIQDLYEERVRAPYGLDLYMGLPESLEDRYVPVLPMAITAEQQAELYAQFPGLAACSPSRSTSTPTHPRTRPTSSTSARCGHSARARRAAWAMPARWRSCTPRSPGRSTAGHRCSVPRRSPSSPRYVRRRFQYPPEAGALENERLAAAVIRAAAGGGTDR
jgi:CubicO group peptidase (beta-lactamase class C family)